MYWNHGCFAFSADSALDRFAMQRFYDDKLLDVTQPSQNRCARSEYITSSLDALIYNICAQNFCSCLFLSLNSAVLFP